MTAASVDTVERSLPRRAVSFAWSVPSGIARDFVWAALRDGVIRLKGFTAAMKVVVVVASAVLLATIVAFAVGDVLRHDVHLLVMPGGLSGRGTLVPDTLVPVTFLLFALGSALALAGALHAAVPVRIGVLALYAGIAVSFQGLAQSVHHLGHSTVWPGWVMLVGVAVVFIVRWRAAPKPAAEFGVLFLLVAVAYAVSENALVRSDQLSGYGYAIQGLSILLGFLVLLAAPLLFAAGLDVIAFGAQASTWVIGFIDRRVARPWVFVLLVALVGWRVHDLGRETVNLVSDGGFSALDPALGALVLVVLLWSYWILAGRMTGTRAGVAHGEDKVAHERASIRLPLGVAYSGLSLVLVPLLLLLQCLGYFGVNNIRLIQRIGSVADFFSRSDVVTAYRSIVGVLLAAIGLVLARRGSRPVAIFVGAIGLTDLLQQLYTHVNVLNRFEWGGPENLDLAWMLVFLALGLWWLARSELTEIRAERLLFVVLLAALLRQFEFVSDPFAPLLGFAGVGFVAFGLIWGFLTAGGWANEDSARFPRSSRTFLYLGYSLFSVALLNWFAASHDVPELARFQGFGSDGVALLGYPLLYALFLLVLAGALVDRPIDIEEEEAIES